MQEFVVTAPNTIAFREYEEPPLATDQVRIKTIVSGIKHGTEMALYTGKTPFIEGYFDSELRMFVEREGESFYPCNLGSWATGEVIEVGRDVQHFKVGDIVHGEMPHRPTNVRSESQLFHLKPGMKSETAPFTDPTIYALTAVHDAQIKVGDDVAVYGLGALGLIAVQIARMNGARHIFAVDLFENRRELALQFGADAAYDPQTIDPAMAIKGRTDGNGVDVVIEISGAYPALQTALRTVRPAGTVVTASYYKGTNTVQLGAEWHHNRPALISSMPVWGMPHRCYPLWDLDRIRRTALNLLEDGKIETDPMISKRYAYQNAAEAYQLIAEHPEQTIKTFLDYGD